jgi:hypothetical protein
MAHYLLQLLIQVPESLEVFTETVEVKCRPTSHFCSSDK